MGKIVGIILVLAVAVIVGIAGIAAYFYKRTMKRNRAKVERTIKMSGTDWSQYKAFLEPRKKALFSWPHEDVYLTSADGLKLHATYFPGQEGRKLVICFHGYTSQSMSDYIGLSDYYYRRNGYKMLLVDERAHGMSEGEQIGFGCLDRKDALQWIDWAISTCGADTDIILHGTSMGGATVLMTSGLSLPPQVKGIISDCGFTSPKYVFTHVLHSMYHIPAFPLIQIADWMNRRRAGFGLDECNAAREVQKAKVPILLFHGEKDGFVPASMCDEIYQNCTVPVRKVIIAGASHAESYYKDTTRYEQELDAFLGGII